MPLLPLRDMSNRQCQRLEHHLGLRRQNVNLHQSQLREAQVCVPTPVAVAMAMEVDCLMVILGYIRDKSWQEDEDEDPLREVHLSRLADPWGLHNALASWVFQTFPTG